MADTTTPSESAAKVDPNAESLIGITVGDYKIIDIIGQGGMGTVYTAEHQQLHHKTACKVLRAEDANHPETVERFLQEARFISRIRHINLIDIFDIGELPDKRLYYVMEKLNGRTLTQVDSRPARWRLRASSPIMNQICAGLSAAHAAGLVHRDLKPDNLFLVERPGEPPLLKIMDFGVAKVMDLSSTEAKLTRTGYLVGTPQYMSPEQINGTAVDKRTDIYALGVILYEMSTGTPPFRGDTLGQMLIAHLQQILPAIDPKLRNEDVPAGIEFIIRKALAKDANERYSSVEDLSADLQRLAARASRRTPPPGTRTISRASWPRFRR
jgi:serine/threonine protein kinase